MMEKDLRGLSSAPGTATMHLRFGNRRMRTPLGMAYGAGERKQEDTEAVGNT